LPPTEPLAPVRPARALDFEPPTGGILRFVVAFAGAVLLIFILDKLRVVRKA